MIKESKKAPDFSLVDQDGEMHTLSDYKGQWVLVYFYPRDNTPGCTVEACKIRDNWPDFEELSLKVFGISGDTVKSHFGFVKKHNLPFTLLSDPEKLVIDNYGALREKSMFGKTYMGIHRMSVLVNPKGKIAKIYETVKPDQHASEVLNDLRSLV
jgi:peroxiredoxin Q/BCP